MYNVQDCSNKLLQKSVLRDCIPMCFDICTIDIRVSIRVRGLHLVVSSLSLSLFPCPFLSLPHHSFHSGFAEEARDDTCPLSGPGCQTPQDPRGVQCAELRSGPIRMKRLLYMIISAMPPRSFSGPRTHTYEHSHRVVSWLNLCCLNRFTALSILSFFWCAPFPSSGLGRLPQGPKPRRSEAPEVLPNRAPCCPIAYLPQGPLLGGRFLDRIHVNTYSTWPTYTNLQVNLGNLTF